MSKQRLVLRSWSLGLLVTMVSLLFAACGESAPPDPGPGQIVRAARAQGSPLMAPPDSPLDATPPTATVPVATPGSELTIPRGEVWYPVPMSSMVSCMDEYTDVIACYDGLLHMSFQYPRFMGKLFSTELRLGGYSGVAYNYRFEGGDFAGAGGRSRDFSEGRGRFYSDYGGGDPGDLCGGFAATLCFPVRDGVFAAILLPNAEWLCESSMGLNAQPMMLLLVDLPEQPVINGFVFVSSLLTQADQTAFMDEWFGGNRECEPGTAVALAAFVEELVTALLAGNADAAFQDRFDGMMQLAESVESPYLSRAGE